MFGRTDGGVVESEDEAASDGDDDEEEEEGHDSYGTETEDKTKQKRKKRNEKGKGKKKSPNGVEEDEKSEETNKKKAESIWADFLADVEDKPSPPPKHKTSTWGALLGNKKPNTKTIDNTAKTATPAKKDERDKSVPASKPETVKITQVFEFAGEEVRVEKEVDANSVEAQAAKCSADVSSQNPNNKTKGGIGGVKRAGGLSGLVGLLDSKKQKLTTLEKTKLDWNNFKSEEGIDEELEKHKKSKDGYLDKQAFLERADLRQFEIERAIRMKKQSNR